MKLQGFLDQVASIVYDPAFLATGIIAVALYGVAWLEIFRRAGLPQGMGMMLLVPPLTFLLPIYMAFIRWPAERLFAHSARPARVAHAARAISPIRRAAVRAARQAPAPQPARPQQPAFLPPRAETSIPLELALSEDPLDSQAILSQEFAAEDSPHSVYGGRDFIPLRLRQSH